MLGLAGCSSPISFGVKQTTKPASSENADFTAHLEFNTAY